METLLTKARGRKAIYTSPATVMAASLPQELINLLHAEPGSLSAALTKIVAAHYKVDPFVANAS